MSPQDFKPRDRVIYVPKHVEKNITHRDYEHGAVSRINSKYVFVKFDRQVENFGWDDAVAWACIPDRLVRVPETSEGE